MQITKEMLEAKRAELINMQEELIAQVNVCNGAIESVDFWLSVLESEAPQPVSGVEAREPLEAPVLSFKSNGKDRDIDLGALGVVSDHAEAQAQAVAEFNRKASPTPFSSDNGDGNSQHKPKKG